MYHDNEPITAGDLQQRPEIVAATIDYDGVPVLFRLVTKEDRQILGDYFQGLSAETRRRYGPHPFDRATAEEICAHLDATQIMRMIATIQHGDACSVIAYLILILGIREDDAARYVKLGIPLDASSDCTLAPSVADAYQGKGLGSLLMQHLKQVAVRAGRKRMVLWGGTQATNTRAIHFYHKHGFRTVGEFQEPPGFNNFDMILAL